MYNNRMYNIWDSSKLYFILNYKVPHADPRQRGIGNVLKNIKCPYGDERLIVVT